VTASIRPAAPGDAPGIARVFAHFVETSTATFELNAPDARAWAAKVADLARAGWPFLVAVDDDVVLGFAYVSPWRPRPAYAQTVEDTIYLDPAVTGRGLGTSLLTRLLVDAAAAGAREVIAVVADAEDGASLALHRRAGFSEVGRLERVGRKFDRWLGTTLLQRSITEP